ncbi:MAG: molybdenum ABC transporter ATP-binding protein [Rubellimicrobium sp.]|nr:molybdenum ABC transporter ATP-binding protein [Rubellimicrobium sp.]
MTLSVCLRHSFGGFALDATFEARPGITALFGRSGSGKTTIVNAVAGLLRPQTGRITLEGRTLLDTGARVFVPPHRRRIGYVFQDARLFPHLSVRGNLLYGRRGEGGPDLQHIAALLGIEALLDRRPGALSGGERQRVAIGRAILSNPALLLLDEPLAALDEARKSEILPYLERLRDETGLPMLYVSHSVPEVARLATTLVLIEAGRITASGATAALLADPGVAAAWGQDTGALITGRVTEQAADGLTGVATAAGPLWLPQIDAAPGAMLRLHVHAQDVMIALQRPEAISALNILPARVAALRPDRDGVLVGLALGTGSEQIIARITRRSADRLALAPGVAVHAVLKAVTLAREGVGVQAPVPRP